LQNQSLPVQQINVQNQPITISSQQTPQLQTQNIQTASTGTGTGQPQGAIQQQPVVVMMEPGANYQTTLFSSQNTINQNFVGQPTVAGAQQTFNTFNQSTSSQTQFNTFNPSGQPPQPQQSTQLNYAIAQTTQQSNQQSIPAASSNQIQGSTTIQTVDQPQSSQSLMFKGDTQDITRMTRVENTTSKTNTNGSFLLFFFFYFYLKINLLIYKYIYIYIFFFFFFFLFIYNYIQIYIFI